MKQPSLSKAVITTGILAGALLACSLPARARQTNEVQQAEPSKHKFFEFEGGTPFDFIKALDRHFRTRLVQILTLPETLQGAEVPKIRVAANQPQEVLGLYNRLDDPQLGKWKWEPETGADTTSTNFGVLALVPDQNLAASNVQRNTPRVQALPLGAIDPGNWDSLTGTIQSAVDLGQRTGQNNLQGRFFIQRDARVLIAAGSEAYIDAVSSVVAAYKQNAGIYAAEPGATKK